MISRKGFKNWIQLPDNQKVTYMTTYAPERVTYPKWQFWRKTVTNYYLVVATDKARVYVIRDDDELLQVEEKRND